MDHQKKEKIIESATNILSRFGIKKSTMDEIAQKIRMGKSTLYHYFKNKEEIFLEVVKRESDTLKNSLNKPPGAVKKQVQPGLIYSNTGIRSLKISLLSLIFPSLPITQK